MLLKITGNYIEFAFRLPENSYSVYSMYTNNMCIHKYDNKIYFYCKTNEHLPSESNIKLVIIILN